LEPRHLRLQIGICCSPAVSFGVTEPVSLRVCSRSALLIAEGVSRGLPTRVGRRAGRGASVGMIRRQVAARSGVRSSHDDYRLDDG